MGEVFGEGISFFEIVLWLAFLFSPPLSLGWGEGARRADEGDEKLDWYSNLAYSPPHPTATKSRCAR